LGDALYIGVFGGRPLYIYIKANDSHWDCLIRYAGRPLLPLLPWFTFERKVCPHDRYDSSKKLLLKSLEFFAAIIMGKLVSHFQSVNQLLGIIDKDTTELRCAQAILLPALMGTALEQTAALLGVSRASVPRLQARFRQCLQTGKSPPRNRGGRRRELMAFDEEKRFLAPWEQQAKDGGILVVSAK
jgi:hypothetical protein